MDTKHALNVLLETKNEYAHELTIVLTPHIKKYFMMLYNDVKKMNRTHRYLLKEFQDEISKIANWTDHEKTLVYESIKDEAPHIDNLVNSVLVLKSKILSSIKSVQEAGTTVTITNPSEFVFKCYLNASRAMWAQPHYLYHKVSKVDYQRHIQALEAVFRKSVKDTVRSCLPMKQVFDVASYARAQVETIETNDTHSIVNYNHAQDESYDTEAESGSESDVEEEDDYASDAPVDDSSEESEEEADGHDGDEETNDEIDDEVDGGIDEHTNVDIDDETKYEREDVADSENEHGEDEITNEVYNNIEDDKVENQDKNEYDSEDDDDAVNIANIVDDNSNYMPANLACLVINDAEYGNAESPKVVSVLESQHDHDAYVSNAVSHAVNFENKTHDDDTKIVEIITQNKHSFIDDVTVLEGDRDDGDEDIRNLDIQNEFF